MSKKNIDLFFVYDSLILSNCLLASRLLLSETKGQWKPIVY